MSRHPGLTIGLVTTWFGSHLKGGAEQQARELVCKLRSCGHRVSVLTSCSESFTGNWDANYYKPGGSEDQGVQVCRFPVGSRKSSEFNRVVTGMLEISGEQLTPGFSPVNAETERIYWDDNINSPALIQWLSENQSYFDFVIFMPYLFPLAKRGIELLGKKAILQPCLHDEVYAYLDGCHEMFSACGGLLFNSRGELELACRIMGPWIEFKSVVVGEGIDFSGKNGFIGAKRSARIPDKFLLCLGRRSKEKNTYELITAFETYQSQSQKSKMALVLAGPESLNLNSSSSSDFIIDLGLVSEDEKVWLLKHCLALIVPGKNESFSRVLYESWFYGRPVAVHEDCLATSYALEEAGEAGWLIGSEEKWQKFFPLIENTDREILAQAGQIGRQFSVNRCSWDSVMANYQQAFDLFKTRGNFYKTKRILFILPWTQEIPDLYQKDLVTMLRGLKRFFSLNADLYSFGDVERNLEGFELKPLPDGQELGSLVRRWSSAVWLSDRYWGEAARLFKSIRCQKYRRVLYPESDNASEWPSGFFDMTLSPFSGFVSKWGGELCFLPPLPLRSSRAEIRPDKEMKRRILSQKLNVIFLGNDDGSQDSLESLIIALSGSEHRGYQIYIPGQNAVDQTEVRGSILLHKIPESVFRFHFPEYITSCDIVVFSDDPWKYLPDLELILSYQMPACCLNSPWFSDLLRVPDFNWNVAQSESDPIMLDTYIKLCATDDEFWKKSSELSAVARCRIRYASHPGNFVEMFN